MKTIRRVTPSSDKDDESPLKSLAKTREEHLKELRALRNEVALPTDYTISRLRSLAEAYDVQDNRLKSLTEKNYFAFGELVGKVEKVVMEKQEQLAGIIQAEKKSKSMIEIPDQPMIEEEEPEYD